MTGLHPSFSQVFSTDFPAADLGGSQSLIDQSVNCPGCLPIAQIPATTSILEIPKVDGSIVLANPLLARSSSLIASQDKIRRNVDDRLTGTSSESTLIGNFKATANGKSTFTIKAEGRFTDNASGDYDGEPLDITDDALIYAGKGFTLNGSSVLPVKRDAQGNPILDSAGKPILVDGAIAVASGYGVINAPNNQYSNLVPPQVVETQTVVVPAYADTKQQELTRRIPEGTATIFFDARTPLNTVQDWQRYFPTGSSDRPTVIRVRNGGLNIPPDADLKNTVILVEHGSINFNGAGHLFENVVLVAEKGEINLSGIQSQNLSVLASGMINVNRDARLGGTTLIANDDCNLEG
jgi:hypothetical protein